MPKYAQFDSTATAPAPVVGWFDTDALTYPTLPASADLLELTLAEWADRLSGLWAVSSGKLVAYTPPTIAPTLAQQATALLGEGLAVTSSSTAALDGTYGCDDAAQARLNRIAVYLQINGTFPQGSSTIVWLDAAGGKHTFDAAQFKALATAIGDYVAALDDVILGLSSTLPTASATIA